MLSTVVEVISSTSARPNSMDMMARRGLQLEHDVEWQHLVVEDVQHEERCAAAGVAPRARTAKKKRQRDARRWMRGSFFITRMKLQLLSTILRLS